MGFVKKEIKKIGKHILGSTCPTVAPRFIIAGAQKSGTTALHYYLNQHPRLLGSRPKEVSFFSNEQAYVRGIDWYHRCFINTKRPFSEVVSFEATPEYLYYDFVAQRIYNYNPDMKIVCLLRDPVDRCYSAWNMYSYFKYRDQGVPKLLLGHGSDKNLNALSDLYKTKEFPKFREVIDEDIERWRSGDNLQEPSFVRRGIYIEQVKRYIELFGFDNVLIIGFKELTGGDKVNTLNRVLDFIGMKECDWSFLKDEKRNSRHYTSPMSQDEREKLIDFYEPFNQELYHLLDKKLDW